MGKIRIKYFYGNSEIDDFTENFEILKKYSNFNKKHNVKKVENIEFNGPNIEVKINIDEPLESFSWDDYELPDYLVEIISDVKYYNDTSKKLERILDNIKMIKYLDNYQLTIQADNVIKIISNFKLSDNFDNILIYPDSSIADIEQVKRKYITRVSELKHNDSQKKKDKCFDEAKVKLVDDIKNFKSEIDNYNVVIKSK